MKKNLEIIKKLEQIFLNENLTALDKELAKKLVLELYENITFEPQEEPVEKSIPEPNPIEEKIKELEKETGKIIELINTISAQTQQKETATTEITETNTVEATTDIKEQQSAPAGIAEPQPEKPEPATANVQEEVKPEPETPQKEEIHTDTPHNEHPDHHQTISEVLAESAKTTLYDMIKEIKNDTDLSTKLANMPVANISKAITLNEKLMFIRELFGGNAEKYHKAVSKLNAAGSLEEALDLLATYNIDTTKESAGVFIKILYRRFL